MDPNTPLIRYHTKEWLHSSNFPTGMIHRSEFQPTDIMKYVKQVGSLEPKVKGRHSNQTFIDFLVNDKVAVTLDIK